MGECIMTVQEWLDRVNSRSFVDFDGFGYFRRNGENDRNAIAKPSQWLGKSQGPEGYSHVEWFNR